MAKNTGGIVACVALLGLVGCASGPTNDVEQFVAHVKTQKPRPIEALPESRQYRPFTYSASQLRSPFEPHQMRIQEQENTSYGPNGPKPDLTRPKEFLEGFPLDSLKMVGTLEVKGAYWALIMDTAGIVHPVSVGQYLGLHYGKIESISAKELSLREMVTDGQGGWRERLSSMTLSESSSDQKLQ